MRRVFRHGNFGAVWVSSTRSFRSVGSQGFLSTVRPQGLSAPYITEDLDCQS